MTEVKIRKSKENGVIKKLKAVVKDGKTTFGTAEVIFDDTTKKVNVTYTGEFYFAIDCLTEVDEFMQDNLADDIYPEWL